MKRLHIPTPRILALWALWGLVTVGSAYANGLDAIYSPDVESEWQLRAGGFVQGVYSEIITPALTDAERRRLARLRFEVPLSAPGQEPFAFWREGDTVHLSAASLNFVADLIRAYVWLGENHYQMASLDNYMLMLTCWSSDTAPPPPRIATANAAAAGDELATVYTRNAWQFIMLHELGHVLHDPPMQGPDIGHTMAMEMAADRFALDMLGRLHQVPTGASALFQILGFFETGTCASPQQAARHTHPLNRERLRQVALEIDDNARLYAKDAEPGTLRTYQALSRETERMADLLGDPDIRSDLRERARRVGLADLLPVPVGH